MCNSELQKQNILFTDVQLLLADILHIYMTLDYRFDRFSNELEGLLKPIFYRNRQKKMEIRVVFLLFGSLLEDVFVYLKEVYPDKMHHSNVPSLLYDKNIVFDYKISLILIYHMYNVFKHNNGVVDEKNSSGKKLIDLFSMNDGGNLYTQIESDMSSNSIYDYCAMMYHGLENLINNFEPISEDLRVKGDNSLSICDQLLKKAEYNK